MKIEVEIPDYVFEKDIKRVWERNFTIKAQIDDNTVIVKANEAGLKSLAKQLFTLAQPSVPIGSHLHYDDSNSLEDGSCELIIEKI